MFGISNWFKTGPPREILWLSMLGSSVGSIYLIKDYFRGASFKSDARCDGKVAIVTGGNCGIGKETARDLARRGAIVYLLCRNKQKCDRARKEIILSTKNRYVYSRECDLGSLSSIREFTNKFLKEENRLDILVNNAGVWRVPSGKTKDGFEMHLGINHMGHFFLTNLLLNLLKKSAPSRIINVSDASYNKGEINTEDLNSENNYSESKAYNQSKLANILFTKELSERLKDTGVTANAVHPGYSYTELYKPGESGYSTSLANFLVRPFLWIFLQSAADGAQTVLYAALNPDLEKVSGKYFVNCKEEEVTSRAKDNFTAKWLWAVSEKWTRLKEAPRDGSGNVVPA